MLTSYLTGVAVAVVIAVVWAGVQLAWRRSFPAGPCDPDALAGRTGCRRGGCTGGCEAEERGVDAEIRVREAVGNVSRPAAAGRPHIT